MRHELKNYEVLFNAGFESVLMFACVAYFTFLCEERSGI
jgi:hypothetical protein